MNKKILISRIIFFVAFFFNLIFILWQIRYHRYDAKHHDQIYGLCTVEVYGNLLLWLVWKSIDKSKSDQIKYYQRNARQAQLNYLNEWA